MPAGYVKKIPLHQSMIVDHVIGYPNITGTFPTPTSFINGGGLWPQFFGQGAGSSFPSIRKSLGNNYPIEPTSHNNNFPFPNLISNMFDGNKATAYRSRGPNANRNSYITFDFGREVLPARIVVTFPHATSAPHFTQYGNLQIFYHDDLNGNNFTESLGFIMPTTTSNLQGSDFIAKDIAAGTDIATVLSPSNSGTEVIYGDDESFDIKELEVNDPTNGGQMSRGRRYMTFKFFDSTISNQYDISNIEVFETLSGESFNDYDIEFDDALLDLAGWKNPRYYGSKLTGKKINKFTGPIRENIDGVKTVTYAGDVSYGKNPVIENKTTAVYITDSIIGAESENKRLAHIEGHSYINIKQILIIDEANDSVQLIDKRFEDFDTFQKFISSDFPTRSKFGVKIIDKGIQHNLKQEYFVKMNKGLLLKSFEYTGGEPWNGQDYLSKDDITKGMYSHAGNTANEDVYANNSTPLLTDAANYVNMSVQFRLNAIPALYNEYRHEVLLGPSTLAGLGPTTDTDVTHYTGNDYIQDKGVLKFIYQDIKKTSIGDGFSISPSYSNENTKLINNKFVRLFTTGSEALVRYSQSDEKLQLANWSPLRDKSFEIEGKSGQSIDPTNSAAVFINDMQQFLGGHNRREDIPNKDKTELHLTLIQGTKDFAPGFNDERSISTFEVDSTDINEHNPWKNYNNYPFEASTDAFNAANSYPGPELRTLKLKSHPDLKPLQSSVQTQQWNVVYNCPNQTTNPQDNSQLFFTSTFRFKSHAHIIIQGGGYFTGVGGPNSSGIYEEAMSQYQPEFKVQSQGNTLDYSGSVLIDKPSGLDGIQVNSQKPALQYNQLHFQLSFLDKRPSLIANIEKEEELFDGIGSNGMVLIPELISPNIKSNIDYYLEKAGITDKKVKKAPKRPERGR